MSNENKKKECYCGKKATHKITVFGFEDKPFYRCQAHAAVNPNKKAKKL